MTVFVDTSALYALLVRTEVMHPSARELFGELVTREVRLVSTNYVLLETTALLRRRIGLSAVRDLDRVVAPLLDIRWVTDPCMSERCAGCCKWTGAGSVWWTTRALS